MQNIDPRRIALTVTNFPEWRTLAADEADPDDSAGGGAQQQHAYDPAYFLLFSVAVSFLLFMQLTPFNFAWFLKFS